MYCFNSGDIETQKKQIINYGKDKIGHYDELLSLSLSYDGKLMVTAGKDRMIKLWDLNSNNLSTFKISLILVDTLKSHRDTVNCLKFSKSNYTFVSGSSDRTLKMWDAGERAYLDS